MDPGMLNNLITSMIPDLSGSYHKGQYGRIGIIGGCSRFTGAPYYAAISSLKLGADLSYVFCTSDAAIPIKSYSPELIVLPFLDANDSVDQISCFMSNLHALVIGPGLGVDESLMATVSSVIEKARQLDIPIVIDADGFFFVIKKPDLIRNYRKTILTPNAAEFRRLFQAFCNREPSEEERVAPENQVKEVCNSLGNVTIVRKGRCDIISDGENVLRCVKSGSDRRCGGQGDVLSGSIGTLSHWATINKSLAESINPCMAAAFAGCIFTRKCNRLAFDLLGRTMTTPDMIRMIPKAFESLWPTKFRL